MVFLELINMQKVRKAILYLVCVILAVWLQTMILSRLEILGAKPFFVPAVAVAIGLYEGGVWGAMLGIAAGFGCDVCMSDSTVMYMVLFAAFGFSAGLLTQFFINRSFFAYLLLAVLALVITALFQIVPLWIFHGTAPGPLLSVAGLQVLWSVPFAALTCPAVRLIAGRQQ